MTKKFGEFASSPFWSIDSIVRAQIRRGISVNNPQPSPSPATSPVRWPMRPRADRVRLTLPCVGRAILRTLAISAQESCSSSQGLWLSSTGGVIDIIKSSDTLNNMRYMRHQARGWLACNRLKISNERRWMLVTDTVSHENGKWRISQYG